MAYKRLSEAFVDKYFLEGYEVCKYYDKGRLVSIEIMPLDGGQSVYIWNEDFIKRVPHDNEFMCELEMHILEDKLAETNGIEDMEDMIKYFLRGEGVQCFCIDYGDYITIEAIDDANDSRDVVEKFIKPALEEVGVSGDTGTFGTLIEQAMFEGEKVSVDGITLYYDTMSKKEYEGLEEC